MAQQQYFMSQYLQHNFMFNPAAAGVSGKDMVGVSYRSMWSSFPGNPITSVVYGDFNLKKLDAGFGALIYNDQTGPTSRTGFQLDYSYHLKSKVEKNKFSIGLETKAIQYSIDKSKLDPIDPAFIGAENKFVFDAGAGVYWTNDKLTAGASVNQFMRSTLDMADAPYTSQRARLYRHYNVTASYKFQTGDDIYLIPNFMYREIENSPSEWDFGLKLDYQDKLWWALIWKVNQSWSLQAGLKILDRIRATYSYDYYQTPLSVFAGGSAANEVGIRFDLTKK